MSLTATERFRMPRRGLGFLWLLGLVFAGFSAFVIWSGLQSTPVDMGKIGLAFFSLPVGVVLIGTAVRRARLEVAIGPGGIIFNAGGTVVPWGMISGFTRSGWGTGQSFQVRDRSGQVVGTLPAGLERFGRAIFLIIENSASVAPSTTSTFSGGRGVWGWGVLLLPVAYLLKDTHYDRLGHLSLRAWGWMSVVIAIVALELRSRWRQTGGTKVTIDREGIRFLGRAGNWDLKWPEIEGALPIFTGAPPVGRMTLFVRTRADTHHELPLDGMDLFGVLSALRAHGGEVWRSAVLPIDGRASLPGST